MEWIYSAVAGQEVPIINEGTCEMLADGKTVVLHWVTDAEWQLRALEYRLENPEQYSAMGEDVEAAIARLRAWLDKRGIPHR